MTAFHILKTCSSRRLNKKEKHLALDVTLTPCFNVITKQNGARVDK